MAAIHSFAADISVTPTRSYVSPGENAPGNLRLLETRSGPIGNAGIFQNSDSSSTLVRYPLDSAQFQPQTFEIPLNSILAFGEKEVYWFTTKGLTPGLHVRSLANNKVNLLSTSLRGVLQLKASAGSVYFLAMAGRSFKLGRVRLEDGVAEHLGVLDDSHNVVRFGNSGKDSLVLIDPITSRFRIDSLAPEYKAGSWNSIQSPITKTSQLEKQDVSANQNNVRIFAARILSHYENPSDGSHTFVVAASDEFPNTHAVTVNSEGKQLRYFSLVVPQAERALLNISFESALSDSAGLGFWLKDGSKLSYKGVK